MRAVRTQGDGVEVVEVPEPAGEGVRVRVRSAGICGSDLHLIENPLLSPVTLGHEVAGFTADGCPVAIEPMRPCGVCRFCAHGEENLCQKGMEAFYGVGLDGGMADQIQVPARSLVRLPSGLAPANACLVEPIAVGVHGLRRAGYGSGQRVAVVGGGSIGLCAVAAVHSSGGEVALVARHDAQCEAGTRLGADCEAKGLYELVIDAAGTKSSLATAAQLCQPGGTLLLLATYWKGLELPPFDITMKEVRVVPAFLYGRQGGIRDIEVAAALLAKESEIPEALITHRFPLEAAVEAFATATHRSAGAIKVVLEP